jgi:hypothetical protein
VAKTPVRRLIEKGIEAGADYIPDVIETPLRKVFGIDLPRPPRPRQKPKVRTDNPGGEWLEHERRRADDRVRGGRTKVSGAVTGYLKKPIELDPRKLEVIPGAMGERRVPGEYQYDALRPLIEAEGFRQDSPILVGVNHLGDPYIIEGNTRAAVARDLGIDRIPAEVRYFAGGEGVEGPMMPELLEKYMPPSELALDPNFRRFFEGSKAVDEHGEPLRLYHGTGSDVKDFNAPAFLTPDISGAEWYAMNRGDNPNIMPVYLGAKNIFDARGEQGMMSLIDAAKRAQIPVNVSRDDYGWSFESPRISEVSSYGGDSPLDLLYAPEMREQLQKEGFDAVRAWDALSNSEIEAYVALQPTQIKSAIGNRGTYDLEDPDINMARGGLAVKSRKYAVKRKRK